MARRAEQLVIENETMRQQQLQHLSDIGADGQPRAGGQHLTTLVDQANLELTERVAVLEKEYSVLIDQATVLHKVRCAQLCCSLKPHFLNYYSGRDNPCRRWTSGNSMQRWLSKTGTSCPGS